MCKRINTLISRVQLQAFGWFSKFQFKIICVSSHTIINSNDLRFMIYIWNIDVFIYFKFNYWIVSSYNSIILLYNSIISFTEVGNTANGLTSCVIGKYPTKNLDLHKLFNNKMLFLVLRTKNKCTTLPVKKWSNLTASQSRQRNRSCH